MLFNIKISSISSAFRVWVHIKLWKLQLNQASHFGRLEKKEKKREAFGLFSLLIRAQFTLKVRSVTYVLSCVTKIMMYRVI